MRRNTKALIGMGRFALVLFLVFIVATSCTIDITMPARAPTYWCYSDSLAAVRDSFPWCPAFDSLPAR